MEFKMADLGKCRESFQTPWNASYVLANGFTTTFGIAGEDFGWISKDRKSAADSVEQKSSGYSPWSSSSNYCGDWRWRFGVNFQGSEIGRFWAKTLCYSPPWSSRWQIWVTAGNGSKLPETPPMYLQLDIQLVWGLVVTITGEFRRVLNRPISRKKPGL